MRTADLTVIASLDRQYFEPEISVEDFPRDVNGVLRKNNGAIDNTPAAAILLITDNSNLIKAFVNRELKNSFSVYIGDPTDIESAFDKVSDIWSPFDGGKLLKKRYHMLLDHIRCRTALQELTGSLMR